MAWLFHENLQRKIGLNVLMIHNDYRSQYVVVNHLRKKGTLAKGKSGGRKSIYAKITAFCVSRACLSVLRPYVIRNHLWQIKPDDMSRVLSGAGGT